jgi:hypothetical protein
VKVYGTNLWGFHQLALPETLGLQLGPYSHIWRDDQPTGNPDDLLGISFDVVVWPGATPGEKTLYIDGRPAVTFELNVEGLGE